MIATKHLALHEQVATQAIARPDATAVVCGDAQLSYAALLKRANALTAQLQEEGVTAGDTVALLAEPSVDYPVLLLGILQAGAAWLPLSKDWPAARRRQVIEAARPVCVLDDEFVINEALSTQVRRESTDDDRPCYVMFTSGSTGEPRGVIVAHGSVAGLFSDLPDELCPTSGETWSALHAPTFGFSVWELFGPLTSGGTVCIVPPGVRRDPQQWNAYLGDLGVTTLSLTPSGLSQWLAADCRLSDSVRRIVLSGEPVSAGLLAQWFGREDANRVPLYSTYGLTETAGRVAWAPLTSEADAGLLGSPTPDAGLLLVDPATLQPVTGGAEGELLVAGPMLATGYLNDTARSAERFVQLDTDDAGLRRYYRTGDRARQRDDGVFVFAGRTDTELKIRGHRLDTADLEHVLEQHPDVAAAAVVATGSAEQQLSAFVVPAGEPGGIEFWPSLGEYQVYDALLYDFMSADETRVAAYRQAFEHEVVGKTVLDIGTGKDAVLARLCAQAGARHVYAVEVLEDAAAHARELISDLGLDDRITVICGDMDVVDLPESIDVCTQGIIGNIGSSDGIAPIWNGARRFFSADFTAVPTTCTTLIAPVRLPDGARHRPAFSALAADYTRRVFAAEGRDFDVRLCVRNFPTDALLADPAEFERLDFSAELSTGYSGSASFEITDAGWLDGYVLWTRIATDATTEVDFLDHQQAWLPVFFPLGEEPVWVEAGAKIEAHWSCETPEGQVFPDYVVKTAVAGRSLEYRTRHHETEHGSTSLHRALHQSLQESAAGHLFNAERLRQWMAEQLPDYMVPGQMRMIAALPLTGSRKLDRRALADMSTGAEVTSEAAADTTDALEAAVQQIWADVLGRPVGVDEEFFTAGGDSIFAVRLTTEVQRYLDDAVFLAGLYEAPTIREYATWLRMHHGDAVARSLEGAAIGDRGEITPAPPGLLPLAWAQQSLWFLDQLYPGNTAANEQFVIRLRGVSQQQVATAWATLVNCHDVLRTTFAGAGTVAAPLHQRVAAADSDAARRFSALAAVHDYRDSDDADAELRRLAASEIAARFDLSAGPLWRPVLARIGDQEHALLVTAHHIVADGLCVPLIQQELYTVLAGEPLPAPEVQFADFAYRQRESVSGEWLAAELDWWREQLLGATVEPVVATRTGASADGPETRLPFVIDRQQAAMLRAFARDEGVSLFTVLLSLWRVWLARCFGRSDFLLGTPATQRTTAQTADMLGCMVNNIALRNPIDAAHGFRELVQAEQTRLLAALDHSAVPFEKIVEDVEPARVFARHPLFQFMFQFEERPGALQGASGESVAIDVLPVDRASYWDMELSVTDTGDGEALIAFLGVRSDLFDVAALAEWPAGLTALLQAALAAPDAAVGDLPLLSEAQQTLRRERNATDFALPACSLYKCIADQAARCPDTTAVRVGGERYSYTELIEQTERYSRALHASGVGHDAVVGVSMPRGFATIALLLAINSRGGTWMALDPDYPAARLRHMLADVTPQLVVHGDGALDGAVEALLHDAGVQLVSATELRSRASSVRDMQALPPPRDACILFTSGSTGLPKGMRQSHAAVLGRCLWLWEAEEFGAGEVFAHRTSLNFVDAMWEMFGPLLHGGTVDIVSAVLHKDITAQSRLVAEREVTHMVVFPSALSIMLEEWTKRPPQSLHTVIVTGEPTSPSLVSRFTSVLPGCRLLNAYGTSENWDICYARLDDREPASVVTVGGPVANARIYILDQRLRELPAGAPGDLYVAGAGVGDGYINRPELTAERFIAHPEYPDELLFRTGDRASFSPGGEVVLHGRADRQLKLRGVRIEPGEIEALVNARPDVHSSAVVMHGDAAESAWLTLYVVADTEPDVADVRQSLAECLPAAVVPAEVIRLDALPYTPSGKLDTAALAPSGRPSARPVAPRTPTETALLAIWEQALGRHGIGTQDDFFALRGNSLLATQVIARICDEFALDLPLASLFEQPTVAGLAGVIDALCWAGGDGADTGEEGDREVLQL